MGRTYSYYFKRATVTISALDPVSKVTKSTTGNLYYGIRVADTYLANDSVRSATGLLSLQELGTELKKVTGSPVTTYRISHTDVAQRMFLVFELSFTLIPKDPNKTAEPYGVKFSSSIVCDTALGLQRAADNLYSATFPLGANGISYVIQDGSIREKRSRKTAPTISAGGVTVGKIPDLEVFELPSPEVPAISAILKNRPKT